jgi:hypothetical protein
VFEVGVCDDDSDEDVVVQIKKPDLFLHPWYLINYSRISPVLPGIKIEYITGIYMFVDNVQ